MHVRPEKGNSEFIQECQEVMMEEKRSTMGPGVSGSVGAVRDEWSSSDAKQMAGLGFG